MKSVSELSMAQVEETQENPPASNNISNCQAEIRLCLGKTRALVRKKGAI